MLNWDITQATTSIDMPKNATTYSSLVVETDDTSLRLAIEACAEKAVSLLHDNIQDDSLYILFEWNTDESTLSIVVTDSDKQHDSTHTVSCTFSGLHFGLQQLNSNEYAWQVADHVESIKFWLHDYLTTCTGFFKYSLVAIFHSSTRNNTELL